MLRHILIKLTKVKHKEQIWKAAKEKQQITYKGTPKRLIANLPTETLQFRREWQNIFKVMKGKKTYNQDYFIHQISHSDSKEKSKALQTNKS